MQRLLKLPGFAPVAPLRTSPCTRHASLSPPTPPYRVIPRRKTRVPGLTSLMPANIEAIPAERIPPSPEHFPPHWSFPGVYGIYSAEDRLQYVAAVRNISEAIAVHLEFIKDADRLFAVRMLTVPEVDAAPLGEVARNWVMTHTEYDDVPPGNGDAAPEWRVEPFSPDVLLRVGGDVDIEGEIRRVLRRYRVVLFMKGTRDAPRCGFSESAVGVLKDMLQDEFVCVDCLDARNGDVRDGIKRYSEWPTIPQLYVDGEFVGGADIIAGMVKDGQLKKLLGPIARARKMRAKMDKEAEEAVGA